MRRTLLMLCLAACLLAGCAGKLVEDWAARARVGVDAQHDNIQMLLDRERERLPEQDDDMGDDLFAHIEKAAKDGKLDVWREGAKTRFLKYLTTRMGQQLEIIENKRDAKETQHQIRVALDGAVTAAKAIGERADIDARLRRMEALILGFVTRSRK